MTKPTLHLQVMASAMTVDAESRVISGIITVFDTVSRDGRIFKSGSIVAPDNLAKVKLLLDHDQTQPVGYMASLAVDAKLARASFKVPEGPEGDLALRHAATGLRDGMSIGAASSPDDYYFDELDRLVFTRLELVETSLVSVAAFADAGVESVAAALAAHKRERETVTNTDPGQQQQQQAPAATTPVTAAPAAPAAAVAPPEVTAGPQLTQTLVTPVTVQERPKSLIQAATIVSEAVRTGRRELIVAALQDVLPADDAGTAWLGRETWLGQLWAASKTGRPWIESFGPVKPLTGTKMRGWQWVTRPKPAKYLGDKTDVPSNKPTTKEVEATPERWAGGWDIDRIFIDLGDPSFLAEFWEAAMVEYQADSDQDVATDVLTAATPLEVAPATTVVGRISALAGRMRTIGAEASTIWLATDLWEEYSQLKQADVPFWLANATGSVNLKEGVAAPGNLAIRVDDGLDLGTITGYDSRAVSVYERQPIQVQALDVAKGGIDLGFFSYGGIIVNDERAIVTVIDDPTP